MAVSIDESPFYNKNMSKKNITQASENYTKLYGRPVNLSFLDKANHFDEVFNHPIYNINKPFPKLVYSFYDDKFKVKFHTDKMSFIVDVFFDNDVLIGYRVEDDYKIQETTYDQIQSNLRQLMETEV